MTMAATPNQPRSEALAPDLIRLDPGSQRPASELLARAFYQDPLIVHYLPDPARRTKVLAPFMLAALRYCLLYGEVWTTPSLDGLACWLPPGRTGLSGWGMLRAGYGAVPFRLGWWAYRRVSTVEPAIDRIHKQLVPGPHWYLMLLAVEPARQGQGIGSRLIAPRLAQAAAQGVPCYLETMTEIDVAFYRKNGFEAVCETDLYPGLRMWAMLRGNR